MILVHARDGLEVASAACASALSVLSLEGPSVFPKTGCGVATGRACAFLLVVGHATATPAKSVSLSVTLSEGRCSSAHFGENNIIPKSTKDKREDGERDINMIKTKREKSRYVINITDENR